MKSFYKFLVDEYVFDMKVLQNLQEKGGNFVLSVDIATPIAPGSFSAIGGVGIASGDAPGRPTGDKKSATKDLEKIRPDLIKAIRDGKKNGTIREDEKGNIKFVSISGKEHISPHAAHHDTLSFVKQTIGKKDAGRILQKRVGLSSVEVFDSMRKTGSLAFDQKKGKVYFKHKGKVVDLLGSMKGKWKTYGLKKLNTSFDPNSEESVKDVINFIDSYIMFPTILMRERGGSNNTNRIDPNGGDGAPPVTPLDPPAGRSNTNNVHTITPPDDPGDFDDYPEPNPPFDFPPEWGEPEWNGEYWLFPNGISVVPDDVNGDGVFGPGDKYYILGDGTDDPGYDWPEDPATIDDLFEQWFGMTLAEFLEWIRNNDGLGFSPDGWYFDEYGNIVYDDDGGGRFVIPIEDLQDIFGNPPTWSNDPHLIDPFWVAPGGKPGDWDGDGIQDINDPESGEYEGGPETGDWGDYWWVPIMWNPQDAANG